MPILPTKEQKMKEESYREGFNSGVDSAIKGLVVWLNSKPVMEELSNIEHEQWMHWTKNVAKNKDIPYWIKQHWLTKQVDYRCLSEKDKDDDRKWAKKVIEYLIKRLGETNDKK